MNKYDEIGLIKNKFDSNTLKLIHFRSMENFILYFKEINNANDRIKIENYINAYFNDLKDADEYITDEFSKYLYKNYISKLGIYYQYNIGFKAKTRPTTFIPAIFMDFILLIFGILKLINYIPIFSSLILFFYLRDRLKYEKINKLWGYRY